VTKPDGSVVEMPSKGAVQVVNKGDRVLIRCAGSGGYGDPLDRDPERVLKDVIDGYITAKAAHELYGVVLDERGRNIDRAATQALRQRMSAAKGNSEGKDVSVAAE
jgi:N-methylhydantoinase B